MNIDAQNVYQQTSQAIRALVCLDRPFFRPVKLLVIGCSSSEIAGGVIGHNTVYDLGEAVASAALDAGREFGFQCAFQCCEHLNRSIVLERKNAPDSEIVCAVPQPKAGGSLATAAYRMMEDPVLVEEVRADAGLDIGQTLIGMHLKRVAVPVRLEMSHIGNAVLAAARTRPKLIGGERAVYSVQNVR